MSNCWKELKQLFSLSGFGWDAEKGTVTAEKEAWDTLDTQKLKSLQKWKRKTCPWYERVDVFFSKSTATGSHARNFGAKAASKDNDDDEGDDEDTSSEEDDEKESGGDSGGSDDEDGAENKKDVKGKGKKREGAKSGTDNKRPRLSTSSKALTSIADGIHLFHSPTNPVVDAAIDIFVAEDAADFSDNEKAAIVDGFAKEPDRASAYTRLHKLRSARKAYLKRILKSNTQNDSDEDD